MATTAMSVFGRSTTPKLTGNVDFPHQQVGFFFNSMAYNWMTLALEANLGRDTNY
jgi:hypothetical protein